MQIKKVKKVSEKPLTKVRLGSIIKLVPNKKERRKVHWKVNNKLQYPLKIIR